MIRCTLCTGILAAGVAIQTSCIALDCDGTATDQRGDLQVGVFDGPIGDGRPVCRATVVASDGEYSEVLEQIGEYDHEGRYVGNCSYLGAKDREGTYTVIVSAEGFAPAAAQGVVAKVNECVMDGDGLILELQRLPADAGSRGDAGRQGHTEANDGGTAPDGGT